MAGLHTQMKLATLLFVGVAMAWGVSAQISLDVLLPPMAPASLFTKLSALPGFVVANRTTPDVSGPTTAWIMYDWAYDVLSTDIKIDLNRKVRDGGRLILITTVTLDEQKLLANLRALTSNQILNFARDRYLSAGSRSSPLSSYSNDPYVDVLQILHDEYMYPHDGFAFAPVSFNTLIGASPSFIANQEDIYGRFERVLLDTIPDGFVGTGLSIPADLGAVSILGYWDAGCVAAQMLLPAPESDHQQNAQELINDGPYCPLATVPIGALSGQPSLPVMPQLFAFSDVISGMVNDDLQQLVNKITNPTKPGRLYVSVPPSAADPSNPANAAALNAALQRVLGWNPACTFTTTAAQSSPPCPSGVAQRPDAFVLPPAPALLAFTCTGVSPSNVASKAVFANDDGATVTSFAMANNGSIVLVGFSFPTSDGDQANTWGDYVRGEILNINNIQRRCVGDPIVVPNTFRKPLPFGRPAVQFAQSPLLIPYSSPILIDEYFDTLFFMTNQPPVTTLYDVILSKYWSDGVDNVLHIMYDTSYGDQTDDVKEKISRRAIYGGETVMIITTPNTTEEYVSEVVSRLIARPTTISKLAPLPANVVSDNTENAVSTLTLNPVVDKISELKPQVFSSSDPAALPAYEAYRNPSTKVVTGLVYKVGEKGNVIVVGFAQNPTAANVPGIRFPNNTVVTPAPTEAPVTCESAGSAPFGKCSRSQGSIPFAVQSYEYVPASTDNFNRIVFTLQCSETCTKAKCLTTPLNALAIWAARGCRNKVSKVEVTLPSGVRRLASVELADGDSDFEESEEVLESFGLAEELTLEDTGAASHGESRRVLLDPLTPGMPVARFGKWSRDSAKWQFRVKDVTITRGQCNGAKIAVLLPKTGTCSTVRGFLGERKCLSVALIPGAAVKQTCPVYQFAL